MDQVAVLRARVVGVMVLSLLVCFPQESRAGEKILGSRKAEEALYRAVLEKGSRLGWRTAALGYFVWSFPEGKLTHEIKVPGIGTLSLSPDASQLAFFQYRFSSVGSTLGMPLDLAVGDVVSGQRRKLGLVAQDPSFLAWSPDGQKLAFIATRVTTDPNVSWPEEPPLGQLTEQARRKSTRLFVFSISDKTLDTYDFPDLDRVMWSSDQIWSPDGGELVCEVLLDSHPPRPTEIRILTLATKTTRFLVRGSMPTWSPKGDWIAFRGEDSNCYRIRPNSSEQTLLLKPRPKWIYDLLEPFLWSPDGQWLLVQLDAGFNRFDYSVLDPETGVKVKVKAQAGGSWKGRRE